MTTILVADDNSNIQKMVTNALKDKGIEVIGVANGEAAIKKLEILNPDMVLADVFMPVRDGYELCDWIKKNERLAAVPVFLLVGAFDPLDEHRVQSVKADGVLKKPFVPPDHLIGAVSATLERAAKTRAAAELASAHGEFAASVPDLEETQKLSDAEVAAMTGRTAPAAEPEPEIPEYTRPARVSFGEAEQPMAFGDVLGESATAEAAEEAEEGPPFRASSVEGVEFESERGETPGIVEEMRKPSPDEPPIKVEFGGGEAPELITADHPEALSSLSAMESAPLAELVGAGEAVAPKPAAEAAPAPPPAPAAELSVAPIPEVRIPEPEPPRPAPEVAAPPAAAPPAPEPPRMVPLSPAQQEAMVEEVVDRVLSQIQPQIIHRITTEVGKGLEMLQPQLIERITREVIRPLAEELVRRKTE